MNETNLPPILACPASGRFQLNLPDAEPAPSDFGARGLSVE